MTGPVLTIDIYSDVVCPWCYVGKRRLEQALESTGRQESALVFWRPFQLNPTMPKAGMDRRVYLEAKFGGPGELQAIQNRMSGAGVEFAFERIARTPNTFEAHRLIWFAQQQDRQDAAAEALFHGYFSEGLNIGEPGVLVSLADRAGLDGAAAGRFLESHDGIEAVRQEEARGRQLGIRGVPYFLLNGKTVVSGAQPVETFLAAIEQSTG
jgi:predicted DsbA family dithiol-disulfide isomerase